jgi:hypothetical protein
MEHDRMSARKAPFLEHPLDQPPQKIALHKCMSQVTLRFTRFTEDDALFDAVNADARAAMHMPDQQVSVESTILTLLAS